MVIYCVFFFLKQKTAYELRISDWSSDVCSSDLARLRQQLAVVLARGEQAVAEVGRQGQHRRHAERGTGQAAGIALHAGRGQRLVAGQEAGEQVGDERTARRGLGAAAAEIQATPARRALRSEEHTSELQSLMRISYA